MNFQSNNLFNHNEHITLNCFQEILKKGFFIIFLNNFKLYDWCKFINYTLYNDIVLKSLVLYQKIILSLISRNYFIKQIRFANGFRKTKYNEMRRLISLSRA